MKHLQVRAAVDVASVPEFVGLLVGAGPVREARVLDWNTTREGVDTVLYAVEGDLDAFRTAAVGTPGIETVELSATDRQRGYALLSARPLETPLFDAIHRARTRPGLVVRKPIVFRDGSVAFRVVGDPEPLQAALEAVPEAFDVDVHTIETVGADLESPTDRLSPRQREAIAVAADLGYYDQPRAVTQADVADALGCAPATAGTHLRKAEAKLVRAAIEEFAVT